MKMKGGCGPDSVNTAVNGLLTTSEPSVSRLFANEPFIKNKDSQALLLLDRQ